MMYVKIKKFFKRYFNSSFISKQFTRYKIACDLKK